MRYSQCLAGLMLAIFAVMMTACIPTPPVDDQVNTVSVFTQCNQDGCTWNDTPPLPQPVQTCTSVYFSAYEIAMQELVASWIIDQGNGCFINESVTPPKFTLYSSVVSNGAIRASWSTVRQKFIETYGANHAWSLDVDRIGYDLCKKIGHDSIVMLNPQTTTFSDPACPNTARTYILIRYAPQSQISVAQRAREETFIRYSQPWKINDLPSCTPNAGEYCYAVDPNYVSQATTGPVILNGVQAALPASDAWKAPTNATVVYGNNCAVGGTVSAYGYPGAPSFTVGDQGYLRLQCPGASPVCVGVQAIDGTTARATNFRITTVFGSNMTNCLR